MKGTSTKDKDEFTCYEADCTGPQTEDEIAIALYRMSIITLEEFKALYPNLNPTSGEH